MRPPYTGAVGQGAVTLPRPTAARFAHGSRTVIFQALAMPTPAEPAADGERVPTAPATRPGGASLSGC
ncbi:hypothetical protein QWJ26_26700 [Streptomyces sp. CSDS2]|uniref:hypothetical protein n=1 Tax=Streptomyces sp. CSDS2 TaxID=3055051 RepID=UPI0025AEF8C0|nr:hypothetical protein [Streptomyces sp. CSDS2]MDN3263335.1 hypothetical protein [Streptomyces sp. CSDS2]